MYNDAAYLVYFSEDLSFRDNNVVTFLDVFYVIAMLYIYFGYEME